MFEKSFNMCQIARYQTGNVFMKEYFRELLDNIDFELKCPFKKRIYRRSQGPIYNLNSTGLSLPKFADYEKEYLLITSFGTKINGRIEEITHIENTFKLVI